MPFDFRALEEETNRRWPLEDMIAGYGGGAGAPAAGAFGNVLGRMARTARSLWPVRQAAKIAQQSSVGNPIPVTSYLDDFLGLVNAQEGSVVARTAPNLRAIKGDRAATWDALQNLGWKKWMLDVPVTPRGNEPLAIRSPEMVGNLGRKLFPTDRILNTVSKTGERVNPRGFFKPDANIAAYWKQSQAETLPHELLHWSRWSIPQELQPALREPLEKVFYRNPEIGQKLMGMLSYSRLPEWKIGEEIVARAMEKARTAKDPVIRALSNRAWKAIQPEMYRDATRLPLEIPYAGSLAARNVWME